jgi:hypothetical protein
MIGENLSKTVVERIKAAGRTWSSGTTLFPALARSQEMQLLAAQPTHLHSLSSITA